MVLLKTSETKASLSSSASPKAAIIATAGDVLTEQTESGLPDPNELISSILNQQDETQKKVKQFLSYLKADYK